jgi:hypothetical protein
MQTIVGLARHKFIESRDAGIEIRDDRVSPRMFAP